MTASSLDKAGTHKHYHFTRLDSDLQLFLTLQSAVGAYYDYFSSSQAPVVAPQVMSGPTPQPLDMQCVSEPASSSPPPPEAIAVSTEFIRTWRIANTGMHY